MGVLAHSRRWRKGKSSMGQSARANPSVRPLSKSSAPSSSGNVCHYLQFLACVGANLEKCCQAFRNSFRSISKYGEKKASRLNQITGRIDFCDR